MKKDRLLRHQLARLDRMIKAYPWDFNLSAGRAWFERISAIYHSAICRSLERFATS